MKRIILAALAAAALGACASQAKVVEARSTFDPAACYERTFNVYFEDTQLTAEAREAIQAIEDAVLGCQIDRVRIVGFDEAGGGEEESVEASQARAEAVARYLENTTVWPRRRFEVVARGDARAVNAEGEDRPMRRRARVTVTASPPPAN
jgi:peptidoglycan-associated lipoprotein